MKRFILALAVIILLAGGWYAYRIATGKVKRMTEVETEASVSADTLLGAFENDSAAAHKKYLGKVVQVTGTVKSVEKENRAATVVLGVPGSLSSVRCSMDTGFVQEAFSLAGGNAASIKGVCTGYHADDMGLGADVVLNRCILIKN